MIEIPIEIPVSGSPARPTAFSPKKKKKKGTEPRDYDISFHRYVSMEEQQASFNNKRVQIIRQN